MSTDPVSPPAGKRLRSAQLGVVLVVATIPRIWSAVCDQGVFWPDEIFQSLEPAHRFAFGYGFVAWEFREGARSWLFPGALGLFWKLLAGLGVNDAPTLVTAAKLAMVSLALLGIYASMRLGEKLAGAEAALLCGIVGALFPPSLVFGSRCMSEMASGPVCLAAVLLAYEHHRTNLVIAGALAGLAIYLRYQNGLIAIGLLAWLLAQRRLSDGFSFAVGLAMVVVAGSLVDLFTWGAPFHSLLTYVRFNLIESGASRFGVAPVSYYPVVFTTAVGIATLPLAIGFAESLRRWRGIALLVVGYVSAHTAVEHKELRFLMPVVPLLLTLSCAGLAGFIDHFFPAPSQPRPGEGTDNSTRPIRPVVFVFAALLGSAMTWCAASARFVDLGQRQPDPSGSQTPWKHGDALNRLLWAAGTKQDLCGLMLIGYDLSATGGYSYLHRDVPFFAVKPGEPIESGGANYILARNQIKLPDAYRTVTSIREVKLARRTGPCADPPPWFTHQLP